MDLDGHKAVTVNNNYSGGSSKIVPWTPVGDTNDWPSSKPSSSGKKPSNTPSGAYTSDGFDGGSSYVYVPPPPDPRQYYRSLVIGPYVYSTNNHDYIYNQLNKKQSIKELATSNNGGYGAGNYSLLYASTTNNLSKAQTEIVSNNVNSDSLHKAAAVAIVLKPYLSYSSTISVIYPPAAPFIAAANVLADTIILTSGIDTIQKAFTDDSQTIIERIAEVGIGVGEIAYGGIGLLDTIKYTDSNIIDNDLHSTYGLEEKPLDKDSYNDVFPKDPDDFKPDDLHRKEFDTSNGMIYKWYDESGIPKYEWDEDFKNGEHYHILGPNENRIPNINGEDHIKPGGKIK